MSQHRVIVVGTDGSETSLRAVDRAAELAAEAGAKLIIASAYSANGPDGVGPDPDQARNESYRTEGNAPVFDLLHDASARAKKAGARDVEVRAVEGAPADALVRLADAVAADLLVVGNVGLKSMVARLIGSVPKLVRKRAGTEVLVVETSD